MRIKVADAIRGAAWMISGLSTLNPDNIVEIDDNFDFHIIHNPPIFNYYDINAVGCLGIGERFFFDYYSPNRNTMEVRVGEVMDINRDEKFYLVWDYNRNNFRKFYWKNIENLYVLQEV